MKTAAIRRFRARLKHDEPAYGLWITLESASLAEMAVGLGLDWVVIDTEHGHLDWNDVLQHVRAAVRSHTVALVRIAELNAGLIKRVLDIGADGIVVPWIESAEQVRQALEFSKYPLEGKRGIGGERATAWGRCLTEHAAEANDHVLVVPIIETVRAAGQIEEICSTPGLDYVQLGPADFSSSAGYRGQWEGPGVAEKLLAVKDCARRHGLQCGVLATSDEDLAARRAQGFRVLGLGSDAGFVLRGISSALSAVGRTAIMRADLSQAED